MPTVIPACGICFIDFKPEDPAHRPISLTCGHTACHTCFLTLRSCPFCKRTNESQYVNPHGLKGSPNYMIEDACRAESQPTQTLKDKEMMRDARYCFDCKRLYKPMDLSFYFGDPHEKHRTLEITDKDPEILADFIWMKTIDQFDANSNGSLPKFIRASLYFLNKLFDDMHGLLCHFYNKEKQLEKSLELFIEEKPDPTDLLNAEIRGQLRSLRKCEQNMFGPILLAIKDFELDNFSELITSEVCSKIRRNQLPKVLNKLKLPRVDNRLMKSLVESINYIDLDYPENQIASESIELGKRVAAPNT